MSPIVFRLLSGFSIQRPTRGCSGTVCHVYDNSIRQTLINARWTSGRLDISRIDRIFASADEIREWRGDILVRIPRRGAFGNLRLLSGGVGHGRKRYAPNNGRAPVCRSSRQAKNTTSKYPGHTKTFLSLSPCYPPCFGFFALSRDNVRRRHVWRFSLSAA